MIARIFFFLILLILLPDLYIDVHYLRKKKGYTFWKRILWWIPAVAMVIYTCCLAFVRDFAPTPPDTLFIYLFLLGLLVFPKAAFSLFSFVGWMICRAVKSKKNWGNLIGFLLALFLIYVIIYGSTIGLRKLKIRQVDYYHADIPKAFDGSRIVQFTDAHVGSFSGRNMHILEKAIDSINAQHGDMIVFTGDLQNIYANELDEVQSVLARLQCKDGVYSVLGNHDYSMYMHRDSATMRMNEILLQKKQLSIGWRLLMNEHRVLYNGKDSLVIAGMENDGLPPFPPKGDIKKTLDGVKNDAFVVMLQHDPSAWRRHILPDGRSQLTLSGHTHGGQVKLFGFSPVMLNYDEYSGFYEESDHAINVSTGIGGFIPFRFGVPAEIVVITLRSKET